MTQPVKKRYFIEVAYLGTGFSGFQVQKNANSIQAEIEKALGTFFRTPFELTGSSRTDAGVHAASNFFHFDSSALPQNAVLQQAIYNLNAMLPLNIVVKRIFEVPMNAHCRFDALSRTYEYSIHQFKNPFLNHTSYYYPYKLDRVALQSAANLLMKHKDFTAFSKRNTQVKSFLCNISGASWVQVNDTLIFKVNGNRFLRGMVRGLVGTMLKVGRGVKTVDEFGLIIEQKDPSLVDFAVPAHGLTLTEVMYPANVLITSQL